MSVQATEKVTETLHPVTTVHCLNALWHIVQIPVNSTKYSFWYGTTGLHNSLQEAFFFTLLTCPLQSKTRSLGLFHYYFSDPFLCVCLIHTFTWDLWDLKVFYTSMCLAKSRSCTSKCSVIINVNFMLPLFLNLERVVEMCSLQKGRSVISRVICSQP